MHYLESALFIAIKENNPENVKRLIKAIDRSSQTSHPNKANLLARDDANNSFLHYALACGAYDAYEIMLPYYKHENELLLSTNNNGQSLLWLAIARNKLYYAEEIFTYYQSHRTKLPACNSWLKPDNSKTSPLHLAAIRGDSFDLNWLLENIAPNDNTIDLVNQPDNDGNTPLHIACQRQARHSIIILLERGASFALNNAEGKSFLDYFAQNNSLIDMQDINFNLKRKMIKQIELLKIANIASTPLIHLSRKLSSHIQQTTITDRIDIQELTHYRAINNDTKKLAAFQERITNHIDKLKDVIYNIRSLPDELLISGILTTIITSTMGSFTIPLLILIVGESILKYPAYKAATFLTLTSLFASTTLGIIILSIFAIALLTGIALTAAGIYMQYKCDKITIDETKKLALEAKDILSKLSEIEKNNPHQLPISNEKMLHLAQLIESLDDPEKTKTKTLIDLTEQLKQAISDISEQIKIKHKPLNLSHIENEAAKKTGDILSALGAEPKERNETSNIDEEQTSTQPTCIKPTTRYELNNHNDYTPSTAYHRS